MMYNATSPLDGLASAASVLLIIEISLIILLFAALALLIAFGMKWLHDHVIPPVKEYLPLVHRGLGATDRATGQVLDRVADIYAKRTGFEAGIRSFLEATLPSLFGPLPDDDSPPRTTPPPDGANPAESTNP